MKNFKRLFLVKYVCLTTFFTIMPLSLKILLAENLKIHEAVLEEMPTEINFKKRIEKIIISNNILFVLDSENHRIACIKDRKLLSQIGKIGNEKGEFYYPEDFWIGRNGNIYILDSGNKRIQILDPNGNYLNDFLNYPKSFGFAIDSRNYIFLGQPASNHLISVYNPSGRKIHNFGSLIIPSEVYGKAYKKYDESHKIQLNRVHIAIDDNDNIWVGFLHIPLIQKYNQEFNLTNKKILDFIDVDDLKEALWQNPSPFKYASIKIDGVQLTMIIKSIAFDPQKNQILALLGDDRIITFNSEMKEQSIIMPQIEKGTLGSLTINRSGEIFVTKLFSSRIYKLVLTTPLEEEEKNT